MMYDATLFSEMWSTSCLGIELYEADAFLYTGVAPRYVDAYRGFLVGRPYDEYKVFSSRKVTPGMVWPNEAVRQMWKVLRSTQFRSVP